MNTNTMHTMRGIVNLTLGSVNEITGGCNLEYPITFNIIEGNDKYSVIFHAMDNGGYCLTLLITRNGKTEELFGATPLSDVARDWNLKPRYSY